MGRSAASPSETAAGLASLGDVAFVMRRDDPDVAPLMPVLSALAEVIVVEGLDDPATVEAVAAWRPDGVLTFSEPVLRDTAQLARALGLPAHSPETARLLTDKSLQRARLREAGADATRNHLVAEPGDWPAAAAAVGFPAVLKPVRGDSSRNTFEIESEAEGSRQIEELFQAAEPDGPYQLEERLVGRDLTPLGDYVSVESVVSADRIVHLAVTGKFPLVPPFREVGQFMPSGIGDGDEDAVRRLVTDALEALGVELGITHTEVKLTPDGPRIIEVNGRLGGFINDLSTRAGGPDLIAVAGQLALGRPVHCEPLRPAGVVFQWSTLVPPEGGRLESVDGLREVRALPGIAYAKGLLRRGATAEPDVGSALADLIGGEAADHDEMFAMVERIEGALDYFWSPLLEPAAAGGSR